MRCAALLLSAWLLAACGGSVPAPAAKLPASEDTLSRYRTVRIGGNALTVPTILLLSSTTNSSLTLPDGREMPIGQALADDAGELRAAAIRIGTGSYRELQDYALDAHAAVSAGFCDRLRAPWERAHCKAGLYDGKHVLRPRHFVLVERGYLVGSQAQFFAPAGSGPSGGAAARKLLGRPSGPLIACEPGQAPLCTAVAPIRDDLIAVWATRREEMEADRRGIRWIAAQYLGR